jgi:hypothetical protein
MRVSAFAISAPFLEEDVYEIRAVSSGVIALELVGGATSANVSMAGATPEDIVDEIVVVPKPVVSTAWLDFQDAPGSETSDTNM